MLVHGGFATAPSSHISPASALPRPAALPRAPRAPRRQAAAVPLGSGVSSSRSLLQQQQQQQPCHRRGRAAMAAVAGDSSGDPAVVAAAQEWLRLDADPASRREVVALLAARDEAALRDLFGSRLEFGAARPSSLPVASCYC